MKQKVIFTFLFCLSFSLAGGDAAVAQKARKRAKKAPRTTTATQPNEQDAVTAETTPTETTTAETTEAQPPPQAAKKRGRKSARKSAAAIVAADENAAIEDEPKTEEQLKVDLEALLLMPVEDRIPRLRFFLQDYPQTPLRARATEQLITSLATSGDTKLQAGDAESGVARFREASKLVPAETTDKFFVEVVSQFPANLFLRGQHEAALEVARHIEAQANGNAQRLLLIGTFYLSAEQAEDALRVTDAASAIAPEMVAAHVARAQALRLALRLADAAAAYARALELDPQAATARRGLADLRRATGQPLEAAALYREQITADATDAAARAGLILALLDAGQKEEAERELAAALKENPDQLLLLSGAAYWYAAHREPARALELAGQAVRLEPRYTWAQIALARALVADRRPLEAERALRFARRYGRFATLDYELANALAAAGLYEEAAEELSHSFAVREGGEIETRLAGRKQTRAANFIELLAPERRASIFQHAAADDEENANRLKSLLALYQRLGKMNEGTTTQENSAPAATISSNGGEEETIKAARDFAAGDDEMRAFRRLYAAGRLLRSGFDKREVLALTESAKSGVEAAIDTPVATNALLADELRDARARAITQGATPDVPDIPRHVRSNIARGRIEELIGWTLFNENKVPEAVNALRRAVSVLPENSLYWRQAQWRFGTALKANGQDVEALAAYLKSYDRRQPDSARRAILEALYREVNGSLAGLDAKLNPRAASSPTAAASVIASPGDNGNSNRSPVASIIAPPAAAQSRAAVTSAGSGNASSSAAAFIMTPSAGAPETPRDGTEAGTEINAPPVAAIAEPSPAASAGTSSAPVLPPSPTPESEQPVASEPTRLAETLAALPPSPSPVAAPVSTSESSPMVTPTPESITTIPVPVAATPEEPPAVSTATPEITNSPPIDSFVTPSATPATAAPASSIEPAPAPGESPATGAAQPIAPSAESPVTTAPSPKSRRSATHRLRRVLSANCALALDAESLFVNSGGAVSLIARIERQDSDGGNAGEITATTPNWSDILILRDSSPAGDGAFKFTITSVNKSTGAFTVVFKSPCGTKELSVAVR